MRVPVMGLAVLLATGVAALSQTTPPARTTAPAETPDPKLDNYLKRWEAEMRRVQTLSALLSRYDKDNVMKTTRKSNGWAQYMKSGSGASAVNLAALELKLDGKTDIADKIVCTGTFVYQYAPMQKQIRYYKLPKPSDDGFLGLLFGMKAEEARKKFVMKLAKEDKWYVYVEIAPRNKEDKVDFARARLVLNRDTFLPRQVWFEHNNGNEVTWDIPRLQTGVSLDRRTFDAPRAPEGWQVVPGNPAPAPASAPPPRVIRQQDKR